MSVFQPRGRVRFLALVGFLVLCGLGAHTADVAGSSDLPGVGRFEGSEIRLHRVENFGESVFATGPVPKGVDKEATSRRVEGAITRILYQVPKGSSALEVFRNFENRLAKAGYEIEWSGGPAEIDTYTFAYKHPVEILQEHSLGPKLWYAYATRLEEGREFFLGLLVSPHSGGKGTLVRVIAVERKTMEDRMVDSAAMQRAISESGRVALYGIYFETDSAVVKPASAPTLKEIARLMKTEPALSIVVVGHTDTQGSFEHNLDLSRRRADAVKKALVRDHGVAARRLKSAGVGYLAPAATNESAEGRALNRRVELVKEP